MECIQCLLHTGLGIHLSFDSRGVCQYCLGFAQKHKQIQSAIAARGFDRMVADIRRRAHGEYDCLVGVSGGADSSYTLWLMQQAGLRPLMVHCDNGWNDRKGSDNLAMLKDRFCFDLHVHTIERREFRRLQMAFLRARVVDIELISDHANVSVLYQAARKFGIRSIVTGENFATEGVMPVEWVHNKNDLTNILAIYRLFSEGGTLKTLPQLGFWRKKYHEYILRTGYYTPLNLISYDRQQVEKKLATDLGWRKPEGKHFESVFTRFYQTYILPVFFGVDKRYAHLSNQICNGNITKEKARALLALPPIDEATLAADLDLILGQFAMSRADFLQIFDSPQRRHTDYPSIVNTYRLFGK